MRCVFHLYFIVFHQIYVFIQPRFWAAKVDLVAEKRVNAALTARLAQEHKQEADILKVLWVSCEGSDGDKMFEALRTFDKDWAKYTGVDRSAVLCFVVFSVVFV